MARRASLPPPLAAATGAIVPALGGESLPSPVGDGPGAIDLLIARLAERSLGIVTRAALLHEAVTASAVDHRIRNGRLHPLHPGVYAVGHRAVTEDARSLAAVLTAPPPAGLSGGHAAAHWRMLSAAPGPIEVVHGGTTRRGPAGVHLRRTKHLELTTHRGVPIATPARTLVDLAKEGPPGRLELALNEALVTKLVTRAQLAGRSQLVTRLLQDAPGYTRQGAERRLRQLIIKAQFPRPAFDVRIGGHDADFVWREHRLVIEVDGYAAHGTPQAFERDRRLDQRRTAAGYRTLRITWRRLTDEPEAVVARIAAALARS